MHVNFTNRPLDATILDTYQLCPRKAFYRYGLHWDTDAGQKPLDLVFGGAVHLALAYGYRSGWTDETVEQAIAVGQAAYDKVFSEYQNEANSPKDRAGIRRLIEDYYACYRVELTNPDIEVLAVEVRFTMGGVIPEVMLCGRIDLVLWDKSNNQIILPEHKTAGQMPSAATILPWHLSNQALMYCEAGSRWLAAMQIASELPTDVTFGGVLINMLIPYRDLSKNSGLIRIPVLPTFDQMVLWKLDIMQLWNALRLEEEQLDADVIQPVQTSFPRRTRSCASYNRLCPYFTLCSTKLNPIQEVTEHGFNAVPDGMVVKVWDPLDTSEDPNSVRWEL